MMQREVAGQIIYGSMDEIIIRKKAGKDVQIGELLIAPSENQGRYLFQVFDILYGSQISKEMLENIAGKMMEHGIEGVREKDIRNYMLLKARNILFIEDQGYAKSPKALPPSFSFVYFVREEDFNFMKKEEGSEVGKLRSGNKELDIKVRLNIKEWINHHIFIGATTGRGKSNLVKVILWRELFNRDVGFFILDPHDEYFGRANDGLNIHPEAQDALLYLSPSPPNLPNTLKLSINISSLRPWDFLNVSDFSDAQQNAMYLAYAYSLSQRECWIDLLLQKDPELMRFIKGEGVQDISIDVLRRKMINIIGGEIVIKGQEKEKRSRVRYAGVFTDKEKGALHSILTALEEGRKVIIDTSSLPTQTELLISSLVVNMLFERYKRYKRDGTIKKKAKIAVLLEEAPRIIAASRHNIFETIAREGRKFNIGIVAITQLPSLIPPEILANMNTKIILGMEMEKERNILVASSPQDLSKDGKVIASLDKGEGIITSIFTRFAVPFKAYDFNKILQERLKDENTTKIVRRGFGNE